MSVISDFLIKQVKEKGWISVGNIMFEDAVPNVNPITSAGLVALSPSAQLFFSCVRMDTHTTYVIEQGYLVQDDRKGGVQQTIVCEPFDRLRHFDVLLMSDWVRENEDKSKFLYPKYPKIAEVKAMVADKETNLFPDTDTVEDLSGIKRSAIDLYTEEWNVRRSVVDYVGLDVVAYQQFITAQEKFKVLCNEFFGLSDCI